MKKTNKPDLENDDTQQLQFELMSTTSNFNWPSCLAVCFIAFLIFLCIFLFIGEPDIKDSIQWVIQSHINDGFGPYRTPLPTN